MQSLFRQARARHSHVAVALSSYSFMDAMPESGVQVRPLGSYLNENRNFQVYRSKQLLVESKLDLVRDSLQYYSQQRYSLRGLVFQSWRHSFCSELAAKAYSDSGVQLTIKECHPRHVLPVDIYSHVSVDPNWIEVTQEYRDAYFDSPHLALLDDASRIDGFTVEFTRQMGFGQQMLSDAAYRATRNSDEPLIIEPSMRYWSNHLAGKVGFFWRVKFILKYWVRMIVELTKILWVKIFKR